MMLYQVRPVKQAITFTLQNFYKEIIMNMIAVNVFHIIIYFIHIYELIFRSEKKLICMGFICLVEIP